MSRRGVAAVVTASDPGGSILLGRRSARVVAAIAIALFAAQDWIAAGHAPITNEALSVYATTPSRELVVTGDQPEVVDPCGGDHRLVFATGRPSAMLCAGGLAWPVLVTPYIGGVHYWPLQLLRPLHHGDPLAVRRAALLIGVWGLLALFVLVERVGDPVRAAMSVCAAAVLPILLVIQSYGLMYELLPAVLVVTAATVVALRPDPTTPPTARRSRVAGAVAGLALFANVKAVVLVVPLLAIALYESRALRRTPWPAWGAALLGGALAIAPMVVTALMDPQRRMGHEVVFRLSIAESRLDVRLLAAEVFHLLVNAADFGYYGDIELGRDGRLWPATLAVYGVPFLYAVASLIRALRRRPHDRIAAACGGLQVFYLLFVWLVYNQAVATNYSPLALSFVTALGCTIAAAAEWAARHGRRSGRWLAGTAALAVSVLAINAYRRPELFDAPVSVNADAARTLGAYLRGEPDAPIAVTSNNLVGLPDALTGRSSVRLDIALNNCGGAPDEDACAGRVLVAAIEALPGARFLVPLETGIMDKPLERRLVELLADAAARTGNRVHEEARFTTGHGVPVLALMTLRASPSAN